jgi:hypothetical protein
MKSQAPLVRSQGTAELHSKSTVDLHFSPVIQPGNPEDYLPLRLNQSYQDAGIYKLGMSFHKRFQGFQHFLDGLQKFGFMRISFD